jgi:aminoglycoside 2'-N-acetyltransferase I
VTGPDLRIVATSGLTRDELRTLRTLFDAAWSGKDGEFDEDDWNSATGGVHVMLEVEGRIRSHASVVERVLETGGLGLHTGYVEAVATRPEDQGRGFATQVMRAVGAFVGERYELGALDTGITEFYLRLGWELWRGPTAVRTERGVVGTPDEDGLVMIMRTLSTPAGIDLDEPISCDWRPGDVW